MPMQIKSICIMAFQQRNKNRLCVTKSLPSKVEWTNLEQILIYSVRALCCIPSLSLLSPGMLHARWQCSNLCQKRKEICSYWCKTPNLGTEQVGVLDTETNTFALKSAIPVIRSLHLRAVEQSGGQILTSAICPHQESSSIVLSSCTQNLSTIWLLYKLDWLVLGKDQWINFLHPTCSWQSALLPWEKRHDPDSSDSSSSSHAWHTVYLHSPLSGNLFEIYNGYSTQ